MKRFLAIILAGLMLLSLAACGGKKDDNVVKMGELADANFSSNAEHEAHLKNDSADIEIDNVKYNNLTSALMDLESGKISILGVNGCTADYIVAHNDKFSVEEGDVPAYSSMMTLDSNQEVYDILNNAIKEMKTDGTLESLIENKLKAYIESDPVAKDLPHFDGARTIKIGVTGDVPPMDFVAANGQAAGFNIAFLAEIANRAQVNIELVQIETASRPMALSSNKVDAVFWTKGAKCPVCGAEDAEKVEGTLVTESYYSDYFVKIKLKSDK